MITLAQHYALALNSIKGEDIVINLVGVLKEKGYLKLLPSILVEYRKLQENVNKKDTTRIYVDKLQDIKLFEREIQQASKKLSFDLEKSEIIETKSVIGGFLVERNGYEIDKSYRKMLENLYKNLMSVTVV